MVARFSFPTTIHFGPGARKLVAEHLRRQGLKRPLVVTDRGLATLPILHDFAEELGAAPRGQDQTAAWTSRSMRACSATR